MCALPDTARFGTTSPVRRRSRDRDRTANFAPTRCLPKAAAYRTTCPVKETVEMSDFLIDRAFGRQAFGADPGRYHAARPAYPDWVFEVLCEQCGLAGGTTTFEIGAGTGTATRRLLDMGASP